MIAPIGHIQMDGDYEESWQPLKLKKELLEKAKDMAKLITDDLGGAGLYGVEFFVKKNDIIFSELESKAT